jgi:uncharacterized membrane protein
MATLTVLKFETPDGAEQALGLMTRLQNEHLIMIDDAATVSWPKGDKKPKTKQATSLAGRGALDGAFWGMLFGLLFFIPFLGLAIGAAMGALAGAFTDVGIDDKFIKQVRSQVTEGTSALFLLSAGAVLDRVVVEMRKELPPFELIASNLSQEQEDKLKAAFA